MRIHVLFDGSCCDSPRFALLLSLPAHGLQPSLVSYNASISATEKAAQWQWALHGFDAVQERALERDVARLVLEVDGLWEQYCRLDWLRHLEERKRKKARERERERNLCTETCVCVYIYIQIEREIYIYIERDVYR